MIESIKEIDCLVMGHAECVICLMLLLTVLSMLFTRLPVLSGLLALLVLPLNAYVVYWILQGVGLVANQSPKLLPNGWNLQTASLVGLAFFSLLTVFWQFGAIGRASRNGSGPPPATGA